MCREKEGSDFQGSWSGNSGCRNKGRFQEIGKRLDQPKQDGALVDGKV